MRVLGGWGDCWGVEYGTVQYWRDIADRVNVQFWFLHHT